jgi:hypothetical protein
MKFLTGTNVIVAAISVAGLALTGRDFAQQGPTVGASSTVSQMAADADRGGGLIGRAMPTTFTSKIGFLNADPIPGASYPRVIQLKDYAAAKGQLLASFSRMGGSPPIYRSSDNGDSWELFSEVPMLRGAADLYELPVKMGDFPAGTILAAGGGVPRPDSNGSDPSRRTLDVAYSSDGGKTWNYLSTIAVGGPGRYDPADRAGLSPTQNPIFEPYLCADAAGRLVAHISDERYKADGYSQLLDHVVSTDGGRTWGKLVFDVAIADGLTRPGMAIVARAGNGKFYMSYEEVGMPGYALEPRSNPAHFKVSDDGDNWGDFKDYGTLIQDRWRQYINGTPYIVWSPWGGSNGTLLASGRGIVRYDLGRVGDGLMINRNNGEGLWTLIDTPIHYDPSQDGYSQTMIPLGDGQEILQLVPVDGRIEYAKFNLPKELPAFGFPWGGAKATDEEKR